MDNAQYELNEKFIEEMKSNLYIAEDGDIYRAINFQDALKQANDPKYSLEPGKIRLVKPFNINGSQWGDLLEIISALKVLTDAEDSNDFESSMHRCNGNYNFYLEQTAKDMLDRALTLDNIVKRLKKVSKKMHDDYNAICFFKEERKETESNAA